MRDLSSLRELLCPEHRDDLAHADEVDPDVGALLTAVTLLKGLGSDPADVAAAYAELVEHEPICCELSPAAWAQVLEEVQGVNMLEVEALVGARD